MSSRCKKCGGLERYASGHCKNCKKAYTKNRRIENPEKCKESEHNWRQNNQDKHRGNARNWYYNNLKSALKKANNWWRNNPDKRAAKENRRRTRKTKAGGSYTADEFKELCSKYNNKCLCCGKQKRLTADHVIPVSLGGSSSISNIQPLCKSCNSTKGANTTDYRSL